MYQFLKKLKIEEFILEFQKQTCYLDVLAEASNEELDELLEKLKIETIGVRLRFKRAVEELRGIPNRCFYHILIPILKKKKRE